jgi:hypothetical protein
VNSLAKPHEKQDSAKISPILSAIRTDTLTNQSIFYMKSLQSVIREAARQDGFPIWTLDCRQDLANSCRRMTDKAVTILLLVRHATECPADQ